MARLLTGDEYAELIRAVQFSAFRIELQSEYVVPGEQELLAQLKAGTMTPVDQVPSLKEWFAQVRRQTSEGKRIQRVRVNDDPPTEYQRLELWAETWNVEAGETIWHLTRQRAHDIGLLPAAGPHDWWLLDDRQLVIMIFGPDHRLVSRELDISQTAVARAVEWRDLAITHGVPNPRHTNA